MEELELRKELLLGEDSTRQFKVDVHNDISLASEMAALVSCPVVKPNTKAPMVKLRSVPVSKLATGS